MLFRSGRLVVFSQMLLVLVSLIHRHGSETRRMVDDEKHSTKDGRLVLVYR